MSRRRRRGGVLTLIAVLGVGIILGAVALSVYLRAREPGSPPTGDPDLRIEVLNGCGIEGVGEQVAALLRRGGFRVERVDNADHFHYRSDIVVARRVDPVRARSVARWLRGAEVIEQSKRDYPYDVTVVVGQPHSLIPTR